HHRTGGRDQDTPCGGILCAPSKLMVLGRNKIDDRLNGCIERFNRQHKPDRQRQRRTVVGGQSEKTGCGGNENRRDQFDSCVSLSAKDIYKTTKRVDETASQGFSEHVAPSAKSSSPSKVTPYSACRKLGPMHYRKDLIKTLVFRNASPIAGHADAPMI